MTPSDEFVTPALPGLAHEIRFFCKLSESHCLTATLLAWARLKEYLEGQLTALAVCAEPRPSSEDAWYAFAQRIYDAVLVELSEKGLTAELQETLKHSYFGADRQASLQAALGRYWGVAL